MAEVATNFPPQTYSSSFFLNSLVDDDKNAVGNSKDSSTTKQTPLLDCFISTMSRLGVLLLGLLLISFADIASAVECAVPNESPIRFFKTISEYQANKLPFRPGRAGWQGSEVTFLLPIGRLQKNAFISYDSESLIELRLNKTSIRQIDDGAFISLMCLNQLRLDHNNITKLTKYTFQGLYKLRKLDLSHNSIEVLPDIAFLDCPRLESLNLAWNRINNVESLSFMKMTSLKYLNLEHNDIREIAADLFEPLVSLETLILGWNKLEGIEPEKWGGLKKLRRLDLAGNRLRRFDPSYNFSFFDLESLNLSHNLLVQLNVVAINRHLPKLQSIDLEENPWFCDHLAKIMTQLNASRITVPARNLSAVSIHGVACTDVLISLPLSTTTPTSRSVTEINVDKQYLEDYVKKKLEDNNKEVNSAISSVRTLIVVVAFVLGGLLLGLQIILNTNFCRNTVGRIRGDNHVNLENNDVENFRLL